jgi:hypothetical protein
LISGNPVLITRGLLGKIALKKKFCKWQKFAFATRAPYRRTPKAPLDIKKALPFNKE